MGAQESTCTRRPGAQAGRGPGDAWDQLHLQAPPPAPISCRSAPCLLSSCALPCFLSASTLSFPFLTPPRQVPLALRPTSSGGLPLSPPAFHPPHPPPAGARAASRHQSPGGRVCRVLWASWTYKHTRPSWQRGPEPRRNSLGSSPPGRGRQACPGHGNRRGGEGMPVWPTCPTDSPGGWSQPSGPEACTVGRLSGGQRSVGRGALGPTVPRWGRGAMG